MLVSLKKGVSSTSESTRNRPPATGLYARPEGSGLPHWPELQTEMKVGVSVPLRSCRQCAKDRGEESSITVPARKHSPPAMSTNASQIYVRAYGRPPHDTTTKQ